MRPGKLLKAKGQMRGSKDACTSMGWLNFFGMMIGHKNVKACMPRSILLGVDSFVREAINLQVMESAQT